MKKIILTTFSSCVRQNNECMPHIDAFSVNPIHVNNTTPQKNHFNIARSLRNEFQKKHVKIQFLSRRGQNF